MEISCCCWAVTAGAAAGATAGSAAFVTSVSVFSYFDFLSFFVFFSSFSFYFSSWDSVSSYFDFLLFDDFSFLSAFSSDLLLESPVTSLISFFFKSTVFTGSGSFSALSSFDSFLDDFLDFDSLSYFFSGDLSFFLWSFFVSLVFSDLFSSSFSSSCSSSFSSWCFFFYLDLSSFSFD